MVEGPHGVFRQKDSKAFLMRGYSSSGTPSSKPMKTSPNMCTHQRVRPKSNSPPECITSTSPGCTWRICRGWGKAPVSRYSRAHQRPSALTLRRMAAVVP